LLTVEVFSDYFRSKVAKIRQSTAGAVIGQRSTKAFDIFDPVTVDEVIKLLPNITFKALQSRPSSNMVIEMYHGVYCTSNMLNV